MKIKVFIEREKKSKIIGLTGGKVGDLLCRLGINPESVIIARGRDLLTKNSPLKPRDKIRIIHIKASD